MGLGHCLAPLPANNGFSTQSEQNIELELVTIPGTRHSAKEALRLAAEVPSPVVEVVSVWAGTLADNRSKVPAVPASANGEVQLVVLTVHPDIKQK